MKITHNLIIVIIVLLSLAAGIAKVMHNPQEVQFLQSFAFNDLAITVYGIVQILAALALAVGVLICNNGVKLLGVVVVAFAFLISSVLIFVSGDWGFGFISLLPVALTGLIIKLRG
mgnify:CR=1 FL=1